jgi:N-acetylmuramoyl-L-alanine amidase
MALSDYAYAGAPDLTPDQFRAILEAAGSPGADEATGMYDALVRRGVRPSLWLAHWHHESGFGTNPRSVEIRYGTMNPGAVRSIQNPEHGGVVIPTDRGPFVEYPTREAAARDWAERLRGPKYEGDGLLTVRQVIPRYAPASDNNEPTAYIDAVLADIERWVMEAPTMPAPLRVALAAGHHNTDGGNVVEHRLVGEITEAWARHLRALPGVEVTVLTPDGPDPDTEPGDGEYPGGLQSVGRRAAELNVDLFVEMHTEAGPRGVFCIYPDWDDDIDADVRDRLGPDLAVSIAAATGLPVRTISGATGVMSERLTGVGMGGHRLGVFAVTAHKRETMTRLLVEHGAHSSALDLEILGRPATADLIGRAAATVVAHHYGLATPDPAQFNVGPGVRAAMERARDVAVGHETYLVNGLSTTPGRDALYLYLAASDSVYRAPKV